MPGLSASPTVVRFTLVTLALVLLASSSGCRLLALGVACELDGNCKDDETCVDGLCARGLLGRLDGGAPPDDAGPQLPDCKDPADDPEARLIAEGPLVIDSPDDLAQLEGILVLEGQLHLSGGPGLEHIELPDLVEVTNDLRLDAIDGVMAPPFTASLPCLARVGLDVVIDGDIATTFALPRLADVGRNLTIEDGYERFSLPALTRVGASVLLKQLLVADLSGLSQLRDLGTLRVIQNALLTSLTGLERISEVRQVLRVQDNPLLTTLSPIDDVTSVGQRIFIERNSALPECEAERLRDRLIDDGFRGPALVRENDETASCPWLNAEPCPPVLATAPCPAEVVDLTLNSDLAVADALGVTCAGNVVVAPGVTSVCLPALFEIQGSLTLGDGHTASRIDLPALRSVGSIYGSGPALTVLALPRLRATSAVELFGLPVLERLYVPRLESVAGPVRLRDSSTPLVYFPQLADVVGELEVIRLANAADLHLPWLQDVDGALRVRETTGLTGLAGLAELAEAGELDVVLNASLVSFEGLGLARLFGNVVIDQNPVLVSVDGIDPGLAFSGNLVTVTNNACLPQLDAQAWANVVSPGANIVANNGISVCQ